MKQTKIMANKDSYGFQDRGWRRGDFAFVTSFDFPEAKHFSHLDGSPLVDEAKAKEDAEKEAKAEAKAKADADKKAKEDAAKK